MLERIYVALWGIYFIAIALFYMVGILNATAAVVFGMVFFGMIFMGMIGVLPFHVTHSTPHMKH